MPVTDALPYLHGSGSSAYGPITSTANAASSGTIAGTTLTVTTLTTGQVVVGQTVTGPGVASGTIITGLGNGIGLGPEPPTPSTFLRRLDRLPWCSDHQLWRCADG